MTHLRNLFTDNYHFPIEITNKNTHHHGVPEQWVLFVYQSGNINWDIWGGCPFYISVQLSAVSLMYRYNYLLFVNCVEFTPHAKNILYDL